MTQKINTAVKDMSLNDNAEDEDEEEQNVVVNEPGKTWNIGVEVKGIRPVAKTAGVCRSKKRKSPNRPSR